MRPRNFATLYLALSSISCIRMKIDFTKDPAPLPAGVEAISTLGDTLRSFPLAPAVRTRYEQQLAGGQWGAFGYLAAEVELARKR